LQPIRLLIADDHPVVRAGLMAILADESDISVVGEARNGVEAVEMARSLTPDMVLMDLRMPEVDGLEAMRRISAENPKIRFMVLTTYDTDENIAKGIEAGARGFLLKDAPTDQLFKAIRAVHRGESFLQTTVALRVLDRLIRLSRQTTDPDALTPAEVEVLRLMAKGLSNKAIAMQLFLSESTVKSRAASIFQKMKVSDRTEAVVQALQSGILTT